MTRFRNGACFPGVSSGGRFLRQSPIIWTVLPSPISSAKIPPNGGMSSRSFNQWRPYWELTKYRQQALGTP